MTLAVSGDLHLHPFSDHAKTTEKGENTRLLEIVKAIEWMFATTIKKGGKDFIIAGDTFHVRKDVPTVALDAMGRLLYNVKDSLTVHILVGNHDLNVNTSDTSVMALAGSANIINKPCVQRIDNQWIGFLPWTDDQQSVAKAFKLFRKEEAGLVVGHLGIDGAKLGPANIEIPGHVKIEDGHGFKAILLGHYHKHQQVSDKVWYIGSPLQHSRGEAGEKKVFALWDGKKPTFIENTFSPRFVVVKPGDDISGIRSNDYVKIVGKTEAEVSSVVKQVSAETKIDTSEMTTDVNAPVVIKQRLKLSGIATRKMLRRYVKHEGVTPKSLRIEYAQVGQQLLSAEI